MNTLLCPDKVTSSRVTNISKIKRLSSRGHIRARKPVVKNITGL